MYSVTSELAILKNGFHELGLNYSETTLKKFQDYLEILYTFQNRLHLISRQDYTRISLKHFLPSLLVIRFLKDEQVACDIGSGAGFPSVPVKILRPEIQFTLFESVKKRAAFLEYLIKRLQLDKITVVNSRAEEQRDVFYELILIRAAGKIKKLCALIHYLLKPGGTAIFYKAPNIMDELNDANSEISKFKFSLRIEKLLTPVAAEPISLVFLQRPEE